MVRRLILFNLLLIAVGVAGVVKLRRNAVAFSAEHQVSRIQALSEKPLPKPADALTAAPAEEWTDIATRNPFSFDRNDVTLLAAAPGAPVQPQRPKPILFGTLLLGADRLALLGPGDAPNKSSRPVRVGEVVDGWTLIAVEDKTVVVRWNEIKESLTLSEAQVVRDYTKTTGASSNQASLSNVSTSAPAAAAVGQPQAPVNAPQPSNSGRRQVTIQTPFGPKTMEDPSQP